MDNPSDFQYLDELFATPFNKTYLVVRTYPITWRLYVVEITIHKEKAISVCESSNLGNENSCFSLRVLQFGKLWHENGALSQEQDWQVHHDYKIASRDLCTDGEIITCDCSYPLFSALSTQLNAYNEPTEYWYYMTCLEDDNGRHIETCPNCGKVLQDEEDENLENENQPIACVGCKNYHGETYNEVPLICAIYPSGYHKSTICPDWQD